MKNQNFLAKILLVLSVIFIFSGCGDKKNTKEHKNMIKNEINNNSNKLIICEEYNKYNEAIFLIETKNWENYRNEEISSTDYIKNKLTGRLIEINNCELLISEN